MLASSQLNQNIPSKDFFDYILAKIIILNIVIYDFLKLQDNIKSLE
jgi:hypothetical protein